MFRGVRYYVSPQQLGTAKTRIASLQAANDWWRRKHAELESADEAARVRAELDTVKGVIDDKVWEMLNRWIDCDDPESLQAARTKIAVLKELEESKGQPSAGADHGLIDIE